jgi:hypothetical protein
MFPGPSGEAFCTVEQLGRMLLRPKRTENGTAAATASTTPGQADSRITSSASVVASGDNDCAAQSCVATWIRPAR